MYCSKYILRKLKQNSDVFVQENIREEIIRDSFLFCFPWEEKAKLGVIVWRNMLKYTFRQTPPNQCNFVLMTVGLWRIWNMYILSCHITVRLSVSSENSIEHLIYNKRHQYIYFVSSIGFKPYSTIRQTKLHGCINYSTRSSTVLNPLWPSDVI